MASHRSPRPMDAKGRIAPLPTGVTPALVDDFSLVIGGPFYELLRRVGLARRDLPAVLYRIVGLVLLTWVPLLGLALLQGVAYGGVVRVPLLYDFATYGRFLVGLPLLVVAEVVIDRRLRVVVRHFISSGLVPTEEVCSFQRVLSGVYRLRDSALAEAIVFALAFIPLRPPIEWHSWSSRGVSTWLAGTPASGAHLTWAGWWYLFVASAVVRFFLYRWLWRLLVWSVLLKRVNQLHLKLVATHPDLAGGLGFVTEGQVRFGVLAFAGGVVIAAAMCDAIVYAGAKLHDFELEIVAYAILATLLVLGPLLVLAPRLIRERRRGLLDYGALANRYTQSFDSKWVRSTETSEKPLLGSPDIQSLADLGNSFNIVRKMRFIPISKPVFVAVVAMAAAPFLPLFVVATSLDKILAALLKMLV